MPGVGHDAITWVERIGDGIVAARAEATIDNLTIDIETRGADWSSSFPVSDSPELRTDLLAGAAALVTAMAAALPTQLSRTTIGAYAWLPTPSTTRAAVAAEPSIDAWDPCSLAGPAAAAGVTGAAERSGRPDSRHCSWETDWGTLEIDSAAALFERTVYSPSRYAEPEPVAFGTRNAIRVVWESRSPYFCVLAFDTPFATTAGRSVGVVTLQITDNRSTSPRQACDRLTSITTTLASHLPSPR
ncbi:hypothetical protein [Nocardia sp. AG03]|uniref:hypothetical protein n=1 Tax=Nocardia sp. AG03 TaxID=3025312 RepID=UPI002418A4EB|nr:hypothetical protein [Nocardia sp. AG03]